MDPIVVLITGMCVVFLGIVVLIGIVKLMSLGCAVFKRRDKNTGAVSSGRNAAHAMPNRAETNKIRSAVTTAAAASKVSENDALTPEKRRELIAVISASIAEAIGTDAAGIRIKAIKRL